MNCNAEVEVAVEGAEVDFGTAPGSPVTFRIVMVGFDGLELPFETGLAEDPLVTLRIIGLLLEPIGVTRTPRPFLGRSTKRTLLSRLFAETSRVKFVLFGIGFDLSLVGVGWLFMYDTRELANAAMLFGKGPRDWLRSESALKGVPLAKCDKSDDCASGVMGCGGRHACSPLSVGNMLGPKLVLGEVTLRGEIPLPKVKLRDGNLLVLREVELRPSFGVHLTTFSWLTGTEDRTIGLGTFGGEAGGGETVVSTEVGEGSGEVFFNPIDRSRGKFDCVDLPLLSLVSFGVVDGFASNISTLWLLPPSDRGLGVGGGETKLGTAVCLCEGDLSGEQNPPVEPEAEGVGC